MVSEIPILQICNVVAVLKQRLGLFQHLRSEQRPGRSHDDVDFNVNSIQQTVSMMRRTTEQFTDVSCGNTAALVRIDQFL